MVVYYGIKKQKSVFNIDNNMKCLLHNKSAY